MFLVTKPTQNDSGFTLIEVLIAIFVLAIGILGIAGLQLFAKQNNYEAIQRTAASQLATSIAERMRMNPEAIGSYVSSNAPVPATNIPTTCTEATPCNPTALAAKDLAEWHSVMLGRHEQSSGADNIGGLIAPSACITELEAGEEYRIAIAWRGRSPLSNPTLDTCGQGATVGGANIYGANDEYRRLFVMDTTIEYE